MMGYSLFPSPVHERIEWLASQASLYQVGARYEIPALMIEENADVLEVWQRDPHQLSNLIRFDDDQRFCREIWRELSLHEMWLLCTLIYNLNTEHIQLTEEKCASLASKLAAWLHDQKEWVIAEPDYRPNQLLVISWRGLREFLANQGKLSGEQRQFLVALSRYDDDLKTLMQLRRKHPMDLIGEGARSNYVDTHRKEQRKLHAIFNEFIYDASYIHPFLKNEIYLLNVYDAFRLWIREKIGLKCATEDEKISYYTLIPIELTKTAIANWQVRA